MVKKLSITIKRSKLMKLNKNNEMNIIKLKKSKLMKII
jgi:hypothetical protein